MKKNKKWYDIFFKEDKGIQVFNWDIVLWAFLILFAIYMFWFSFFSSPLAFWYQIFG